MISNLTDRFTTRELVGILAFLERFLVEAEEKGNPFVMNLLEKQHTRLKIAFDRHIVSDINHAT